MTTRSKSIPRFSPDGRSARLKHVLEQVLESDPSSPLYMSVLQHFGNDEDKFNVIDYFSRDMTFFENLTYTGAVIDNPNSDSAIQPSGPESRQQRIGMTSIVIETV